jgi:hypothetical protein
VRALLASDGGGVALGSSGGRIEIDLDVFKPVNVGLGIRFTDNDGRETQVEQPEPFIAGDPGIYRLSIAVPDGVLGDSRYRATLLAGRNPGGSLVASSQELLSFEVMSKNGETEPGRAGPKFAENDDGGERQEVAWDVCRVDV